MEKRRNGASHFLSFVGDYMFQNNKPLISKVWYAVSFAAGVAVVAAGLALLQIEANRMGLDQLYEVSRIDR